MGNKCSLNNNEDDEILTEYDKTIYNDKRERVFYGTIAICVLYASFALLLFLASYLSEKVKFILLNNFLPFTIVYVIGTIIIVFFLIHQVVNFKPFKIDRNSKYDTLSCPDYWTLEKIQGYETNKDAFKGLFSSNVDYSLFKYRCKLDTDIFDKYNIYLANINKGKTEPIVNVAATAAHYYKFTTNEVSPTDGNLQAVSLSPVDIKNKHLFVNILNSNMTDITNVRNKILKDKTQEYELIKNTLIMNNYELVNNNTNTKIKVFKYNNLNDAGKITFGINTINFDTTSASASPAAGAIITSLSTQHYIKVDTDTNLVYRSATDTESITNDTIIQVLPMICDSTYPMYLASRDEITSKNNNKFDNNIFRCAYSKICKVPWSDMNCDKYDNR